MSKMNVNEACTLAKQIEQWKSDLCFLLMRKEYIFNVVENHQKDLADDTKKPEIIENQVKKQYDVSVEDICKIVKILIDEKTKLSELIETTKSNLKVSIDGKVMTVDAATEYNKCLRRFSSSLNSLLIQKDSEVKTQQKDFRLDVEGKQTPFYYPCIITSTLAFNKKEIEKMKKDLLKKADKNSIEIEKVRITSELEFDSDLDVTDSLEEVIEKCLSKA